MGIKYKVLIVIEVAWAPTFVKREPVLMEFYRGGCNCPPLKNKNQKVKNLANLLSSLLGH
jgi:hypothetical protein